MTDKKSVALAVYGVAALLILIFTLHDRSRCVARNTACLTPVQIGASALIGPFYVGHKALHYVVVKKALQLIRWCYDVEQYLIIRAIGLMKRVAVFLFRTAFYCLHKLACLIDELDELLEHPIVEAVLEQLLVFALKVYYGCVVAYKYSEWLFRVLIGDPVCLVYGMVAPWACATYDVIAHHCEEFWMVIQHTYDSMLTVHSSLQQTMAKAWNDEFA
jgi:hypothetical protein